MAPRLERRADWLERLAAVVNERRKMPYRYGTNDCGVFSRLCVEAMTGTTLLPGVDLPIGWLAAARFLISRGWSGVDDMATALLGPPVDDLSEIGPGDIVAYEACGETHLAVRVGDAALAPEGEIGLKVIAAEKWRRGWKVG